MSLLKCTLASLVDQNPVLRVINSDEEYVDRILNQEISLELFDEIAKRGKAISVTENFREVIDSFHVPAGETPAGFRVEYHLKADGLILADLYRDISYDRNGIKRPTKMIFSADTANPYEVEHMKGLIGNLTCNPAIIYNNFINNPDANVGNKYKTRDEVLKDIGDIIGPGCDISVELNDPYGSSESEILEEAARFRELLSKYRVVIKVPHTGPFNSENVSQILTGDKKFGQRYNQGKTGDFYRGHNLALMLREHGYRVNFTLMYEPYQTALALQARPYFINSFIQVRHSHTLHMSGLMRAYEETGDPAFIEELQKFTVESDYLSAGEIGGDLFTTYTRAKNTLKYRGFDGDPDFDGLDSIRYNLRRLRSANLPDTRLIICNLHGEYYYPNIDKLLMDPEFTDMQDRIVLTASPDLLAPYTSSPLVVLFQRRFLNATGGAK